MNTMERDLERLKQGLEPLDDDERFIIESDYPTTKRPSIVIINEGEGSWNAVPKDTKNLIVFTIFAWIFGFISACVLFTGGIL